MSKILNTRIQSKIDTIENWVKVQNTFIPLKGEICIATIANSGTEQTTPPAIMMKVGDGSSTWGVLPWTSALAADVYAWAKKDGITVTDTGSGKFVTDFSWDSTNQALTISRADASLSNQRIKVGTTTFGDNSVVNLTSANAALSIVGGSDAVTFTVNSSAILDGLDATVTASSTGAASSGYAISEIKQADGKISLSKSIAIGNGQLTIQTSDGLAQTGGTFTANQTDNTTLVLPVYSSTKTDATYVAKTQRINGHNLSGNVTLDGSDIQVTPETTAASCGGSVNKVTGDIYTQIAAIQAETQGKTQTYVIDSTVGDGYNGKFHVSMPAAATTIQMPYNSETYIIIYGTEDKKATNSLKVGDVILTVDATICDWWVSAIGDGYIECITFNADTPSLDQFVQTVNGSASGSIGGAGQYISSISKSGQNLTINAATLPTSLKSPYALTIAGTSYDGSATKSVTVTPSNPTLSWGQKATIGTIGDQTFNVTMPANPNTDTNQTVKGNGTAFGATAAINIVPGTNISITADTTNNKITIGGKSDSDIKSLAETQIKTHSGIDKTGTVTSVATSGLITGGTITSSGTIGLNTATIPLTTDDVIIFNCGSSTVVTGQ